MTGDQIWGIARTILAAAGGYFVAKGYVDTDTMTTILGGVGTVFVAVWSVMTKKPAA
ncbi:Pam3-gp28 family putative phage holin [Bradyrhizobium sp. S3.7.6]